MRADPDLYDYVPYTARPTFAWPGGKTVAVWIAPNLEYYEIDPPPNPHRRAWTRPHPDVVGYAHRDHSNRVSHWRMADAMTKHGFPGSVSLSVALCQHHPEVVEDANARGWEFFSHGIYNTRYTYGMSEEQERAIIEDSIATVRAATGQTIRGWLAPALTHTERTLDLIAEYGLDYTCDLYHDDQPTEVKVRTGRLTAIPYSLEVNDHYGFFVYNMSPRDYADALIRQYDRLATEGERSATVMCIPLHAYLIGQPHRIGPFERVLEHIAKDGRAFIARAGEIVDAWRSQNPPAQVERDCAQHGGGAVPMRSPVYQPAHGPAPPVREELAPSYIEYPHRRCGYDHDLYDWSALNERRPVLWPDQAKVAVPIVVSVEWFPMTPTDTPFRAPGHMQTAYPDYRHYTARDYGNRVGVWRLIEAFDRADIEASFAVNSAVADRYPALVEAIVAGGHEIIAHSTDMNGTIASGLDIDAERALIETSFATLEQATGTRPRGWLSIARSESWNTLDLVRAAGGAYVCDWVNDELPYRFRNGLINLPLNHELSDRQIINVQQQSVDSYTQQLLDAFDRLLREAAAGGRMLPLHITPYIVALPYRIDAFDALLAALKAGGAWFASAGRVVETWAAQAP